MADEVGEGRKGKEGGGGKVARTRAAAAQHKMQGRIKGIPDARRGDEGRARRMRRRRRSMRRRGSRHLTLKSEQLHLLHFPPIAKLDPRSKRLNPRAV